MPAAPTLALVCFFWALSKLLPCVVMLSIVVAHQLCWHCPLLALYLLLYMHSSGWPRHSKLHAPSPHAMRIRVHDYVVLVVCTYRVTCILDIILRALLLIISRYIYFDIMRCAHERIVLV